MLPFVIAIISSSSGFNAVSAGLSVFIFSIPCLILLQTSFSSLNVLELNIYSLVLGFALLSIFGFLWISSRNIFISVTPLVLILVICLFTKRFSTQNSIEVPKNDASTYLLAGSFVGWIIGINQLVITIQSQPTSWFGKWFFYNDLPWHLGIVRSISEGRLNSYPYVQGIEVAFPWGLHSALGSLSFLGKIEASEILYHIWPICYWLLAPLLIAAVTWQVTHKGWLTVLAPAAVLLFSGPAISPIAGVNFKAFFPISPTYEFGNLMLLIVFIVTFLFIRSSSNHTNLAFLTLVAISTFVASSTKGSLPPIILSSSIIITVISLLSKRKIKSTLLMLFTQFIAISASALLINRGGGTISIDPFSFTELGEGIGSIAPYILGFVILIAAIGSFVILLTLKINQQAIFPVIYLFSVVITGILAFLLLGHPGKSQIYLYWNIVPLFVILILWSFGVLVEKFGWVILLIPASAVFAGTLINSASFFNNENRSQLSKLLILLVVTFFVSLVVFNFLVVENKRSSLTKIFLGAFVSAISIVCFQNYGLPKDQYSGADPGYGVEINSNQLEAFNFISDNLDDQSLIVSNRHCLSSSSFPILSKSCDPRYFALSAYSGKQVLIEGWGYTPKEYGNWPNKIIELNDKAFYSPSEEVFSGLKGIGVSDIYLDLSVSQQVDLSKFATLVFQNDSAQIWHLN